MCPRVLIPVGRNTGVDGYHCQANSCVSLGSHPYGYMCRGVPLSGEQLCVPTGRNTGVDGYHCPWVLIPRRTAVCPRVLIPVGRNTGVDGYHCQANSCVSPGSHPYGRNTCVEGYHCRANSCVFLSSHPNGEEDRCRWVPLSGERGTAVCPWVLIPTGRNTCVEGYHCRANSCVSPGSHPSGEEHRCRWVPLSVCRTAVCPWVLIPTGRNTCVEGYHCRANSCVFLSSHPSGEEHRCRWVPLSGEQLCVPGFSSLRGGIHV